MSKSSEQKKRRGVKEKPVFQSVLTVPCDATEFECGMICGRDEATVACSSFGITPMR